MQASLAAQRVAIRACFSRFGIAIAHLAGAVAIALVLYPGLIDVPVSRDEADCHQVSRNVQRWLRTLAADPTQALTEDSIRDGWSRSPEHPGGARLLGAASNLLLGDWIDPIAAFRFGNVVLAVLLVFTAVHFLRRHFGLAVALFAAGALFLLPHFYGAASMATIDFPMAVMGFLTTVAFLRGTERWGGAVAFGILMGLAFNTKISAAFVPIPLLLWGFIYRRRDCANNLFALVLLAPLVWLLTWPWLWHDTGTRILDYFAYHREHATMAVFYFGKHYPKQPAPISVHAPWHYASMYLLMAVPLSLLLPFFWGLVAVIVRAVRQVGSYQASVLLLLGLIMPVLTLSLPGVPRYDGPRLALNAYPFLACIAAIGFGSMLGLLRRILGERLVSSSRKAVPVVLGMTLLAPALLGTVRIHPFQPYSYYNEIVGGPAGAVAMGLSPVLGGMADRSTVDYLNQHGQPGDIIFKLSGAAGPLMEFREVGLLKTGFEWGTRPHWVVILHNRAYSRWPDWWLFIEDRHPRYERVFEVRVQGVHIVGVYHVRAQPLVDELGETPQTLVRPPETSHQPRGVH